MGASVQARLVKLGVVGGGGDREEVWRRVRNTYEVHMYGGRFSEESHAYLSPPLSLSPPTSLHVFSLSIH